MASTPKRSSQPRPLLLVNICQLLTLQSSSQSGPRRGAALRQLNIIEDGAVLCLGGKIVSVGETRNALRDPWIKKHRKKIIEIDCSGKVVLPGFVDSHTHPTFTAPRLVDFEKRIAGATYEEIAAAGGGILSSVESVRNTSKQKLAENVLNVLWEMAAQGTTTVEAKSGYGLSMESEIKSLQSIHKASLLWPGTTVPTLLGAHVVPHEFKENAEKYVALICNEMIPQVAKKKLAKFVDVFCDRGAFSKEQTVAIFATAKKYGLDVRAHVCQLSSTELEPLLQFAPASLDHMDLVQAEDVSLLSKSNTVATLVPGVNYFLGLKQYPPARKLIDAGVPVALATDFNPGSSPTTNMQLILSLACTQMKMLPEEAIAAATINGAHALRLESRKGSLEAGKDADLAIFDVQNYREIPYWFGTNRCVATIMNGLVVSSATQKVI